MINTQLFKYYQALNNDTTATLADALELSVPTVSLKVNNKRQFTVNELQQIKERWNLTAGQAEQVFFPESSKPGPTTPAE